MSHHFSSFLKSAAGVLHPRQTQNGYQNRGNLPSPSLQIPTASGLSAAVDTPLTESTSRSSYNPLHTTSSTYTNPSENLPPTPNLRAVDEISDLETDDSDQGPAFVTGSLFANTGVVNYRGVDSGPVALPVAVPGMGSIIKKVAGRQRGFTVPRKPVSGVQVLRGRRYSCSPSFESVSQDNMFENGFYERERAEIVDSDGGDQVTGVEDSEGGEYVQDPEGGEQPEIVAIVETAEERKERLEREKAERASRDLNHENPLRSHPVHPSSISSSTGPTTSVVYTTNSRENRLFRRSYTAPVNGFQVTSMHGYSADELNAHIMGHRSGHGPMGLEGNDGIAPMQRGSASRRYNDINVSKSTSRTNAFLRRASISWRGMALNLGFPRISSGNDTATPVPIGISGLIDGNFDIERPITPLGVSDNDIHPFTTISSGHTAMAMSANDVATGGEVTYAMSDAQRRRNHRQSLILPKFEWEDELSGEKDES